MNRPVNTRFTGDLSSLLQALWRELAAGGIGVARMAPRIGSEAMISCGTATVFLPRGPAPRQAWALSRLNRELQLAPDGAKYGGQIAADEHGGSIDDDGNQTGDERILNRRRPVFEPDESGESAWCFHRREPNNDGTLTSDEPDNCADLAVRITTAPKLDIDLERYWRLYWTAGRRKSRNQRARQPVDFGQAPGSGLRDFNLPIYRRHTGQPEAV
jgi:hypothetical protein